MMFRTKFIGAVAVSGSLLVSSACMISASQASGGKASDGQGGLAKASTPDYHLDDTNSFPFVIPWNDGLTGTATDASFLNEKPAGKNGYIVTKNGTFIEEKTGKRVRFLGTNLAARAAFPLKEDAPLIAAHLAKLGVNIVRFHHLQNDWDKDGGMIWKVGKEQIEFDPVTLDRMDFFIAELKKQGIYSNINLQTTRKMIPELGVPASAMEIPSFQKKVDKMNEKMILLQQQYARDLLDRKNPYTGLKYNNDPAIMVIEINNENSLVGWPGEQPGAGLEKWPEPFKTELRTKWNGWLKAKYQTDAGLQAAWPTKDTRKAESMTTKANTWSFENQSNGDAKLTPTTDGTTGAPSIQVTVNSNGGPTWHIQAHLAGLNLADGKTYTVEFEGKADREMGLNIDSRLDKPDWRFLGLGGSVGLTKNWKRYALAFTASGTEPNHSRVGLVLGDVRGTLQVKNLTIREGTLETGVEPGESLTKGNIAIPSAGTSPRYRDYAKFLIETERSYGNRMRDFLVKDLGFAKANIIDTQASWGGLTSVFREARSSFMDNHEYWNHPSFLGNDWDPKNYRVTRTAHVNNMDGGTLGSLASWRVVGKPYSVSEYDHPAPSDFACEMMPLYANAGALQDWDILYTFNWVSTGRRDKNDMFDGFFDHARNPAKTAFYPSAAILFRLGLVASDLPKSYAPVNADSWVKGMSATSAWGDKKPKGGAFDTQMGLAVGASEVVTKASEPTSSRKVTGPDEQKIVTVESQHALSIVGFVGGQILTCQIGTFKFGRTPTNFASLMLVPIDGQPLRTSKRLLLTVIGRVENTGMTWNAARDSVSDQWGVGPTRAEIVPVSVSLNTAGPLSINALTGNGQGFRMVPTTVNSPAQGSGYSFEIGKTTRSVWYEIRQ